MASDIAQQSDLARRAGQFLDTQYPGPHRNKLIARNHDISPGMAKQLRTGRGWTMSRIEQSVRLYGTRFVEALFGPVRSDDDLRREFADLSERLSRLEAASRERQP